MLRRAGIIGDIHCQVGRLKQVVDHFRGLKVDSVLSVGDIADGPGDLNEACTILEREGVLSVAGNHDRWLLTGELRDLPDATPISAVTPQARRYLKALPKTRLFDSARGTVLLCHGLGDDDMASVKPDDESEALLSNMPLQMLIRHHCASFIINGHSHRPMLRTISGLTILNAGTLHPKHRPVCSIVDFDRGQVQVYDLRSERVTAAESWSFERGSRPVAQLS